MKIFQIILVIIAALMVQVDARGRSNNKRKKNAAKRAAEEIAKQVEEAKITVRVNKCPEIEDDSLLFNCLHYNMSPKCFIEIFGVNGIELGEVVDAAKDKRF